MVKILIMVQAYQIQASHLFFCQCNSVTGNITVSFLKQEFSSRFSSCLTIISHLLPGESKQYFIGSSSLHCGLKSHITLYTPVAYGFFSACVRARACDITDGIGWS